MPLPSESPTRRLFIGLMADEALRNAILRWRPSCHWPPGAALSPPPQWHLTLVFLGQVADSRLPALRTALERVAFEPLRLTLGEPEVWPGGIAVLRPRPDDRLEALRARVVAAVQVAGFERPDANWKPHLTLARKAAGAVWPEQALAVAWRVTAFSLVWSRTQPQGDQARYEALDRWP